MQEITLFNDSILPEKTEIWNTKPADITVSGVSKSFKNNKPILRNIHFEIKHGEAVALTGANGAGKSTLFRCLLKLIDPDTGSIKMLDSEVTQLNRRQIQKMRSKIGLVWQRHNLVPRLSALSNVIHGAQNRSYSPRLWYQGLSTHAVREEAIHHLDIVGLSHLANHRADQLSGGESQRVAIARALMQRPKIMMADEPVASLDPRVAEDVMSLFLDLIHKEGFTLLFTSHDLEHALKYSDRVLGLKNGHIEIDERSSLLNKDTLQEMYD